MLSIFYEIMFFRYQNATTEPKFRYIEHLWFYSFFVRLLSWSISCDTKILSYKNATLITSVSIDGFCYVYIRILITFCFFNKYVFEMCYFTVSRHSCAKLIFRHHCQYTIRILKISPCCFFLFSLRHIEYYAFYSCILENI